MKKLIISIIFISMMICSFAQSSFENILIEIEKNNKELNVFRYKIEAEKLQSKNNVLPEGPNLSYDKLNSSINQSGYSEMTISQSFDFPTIYISKVSLSKLERNALDIEYLIKKRNVLQKAKLLLIELTFQNLLKTELKLRLNNAGKLFEMNQKRIDQGDINILEYNKSKMQYLTIKSKYVVSVNEVIQLSKKMEVLNGGIEIGNIPKHFPELADQDNLDKVVNEYESLDLQLRFLKLESEIITKEKKISNWNNLPSFEAGYRYDNPGAETFSGIHLGMNIPLWNNLYMTKKFNTQSDMIKEEIDLRKTEVMSDLESFYKKYLELADLYNEMNQMYKEADIENMLSKSLKAGQISSIDYYQELASYFDFKDTLLRYEKELHILIAKVMYYQL